MSMDPAGLVAVQYPIIAGFVLIHPWTNDPVGQAPPKPLLFLGGVGGDSFYVVPANCNS